MYNSNSEFLLYFVGALYMSLSELKPECWYFSYYACSLYSVYWPEYCGYSFPPLLHFVPLFRHYE